MVEVQTLADGRIVSYFRLLKDATKEKTEIVPPEGDSSIFFKHSSKSTTTKSGSILISAGLTTKVDQTFYEGISEVSDEFYDAVLNDEVVECWLVNLDKVNNKRQFRTIYTRAKVAEDKPSFKADSIAERSPRMEVTGIPRRGYLTPSDYDQDILTHAFRGIGQITSTAKEDDADGGGLVYKNNADPSNDTVPTEKNGSSESHTAQGGHDQYKSRLIVEPMT